MAGVDYLNIEKENEDNQSEWLRGLEDGMKEYGLPLPDWWCNAPLMYFKPYQRGYFVGRELEYYGRTWEKEASSQRAAQEGEGGNGRND